jgi:hypothetical protein
MNKIKKLTLNQLRNNITNFDNEYMNINDIQFEDIYAIVVDKYYTNPNNNNFDNENYITAYEYGDLKPNFKNYVLFSIFCKKNITYDDELTGKIVRIRFWKYDIADYMLGPVHVNFEVHFYKMYKIKTELEKMYKKKIDTLIKKENFWTNYVITQKTKTLIR